MIFYVIYKYIYHRYLFYFHEKKKEEEKEQTNQTFNEITINIQILITKRLRQFKKRKKK